MTCFWDGILHSLKNHQLIDSSMKIRPFIETLQQAANDINTLELVLWNQEPLSTKLQQELLQHIREFDSATVSQGYLCSSCDAFLCLLCQMLQIRIDHTYCNYRILYEPKDIESSKHNHIQLRFKSDKGHFWKV